MEAGGEGQGRGEASIAGEIDKASWWRSEQHHVLHQYTHGIETRTTRGGFTLRSGVLQVAWLVSEANAYTALTALDTRFMPGISHCTLLASVLCYGLHSI